MPTDEELRIAIIGPWTARFHDIFPKYDRKAEDLHTINDSFLEALMDVPVSALAAAFEEWHRTGKHFPVPGEIRSLITGHEDAIDQYEAEKAWNLVRWVLNAFWRNETQIEPLFIGLDVRLSERWKANTTQEPYNGGYLIRPKPFDARTQFAIENVGGLQRIATLPAGSEFDFTRKGFLQCHRRHSETHGLIGPTRAEAKQLIGKLKEIANGSN